MGQKVSANGRHFVRDQRIIDDVGENPTQGLAGHIDEAGVLRVLRPLRPRGNAGRTDDARMRNTEQHHCQNTKKDWSPGTVS